ncbi:SMP-30/gluconolaconase/LRE-like protein [Massilia sp. Root418]|uniref:SMP-30/gluconolactonase/LRE family protein n=1 Tax=Massilia sp. Root418 TaxID=1736532 RepID=UPI0006F7AAE2|nr:SMP-30/gluconolactonase/LRE family protein [Massilia sp. Root418]KQW93953.1 SMP-30/gluconolaconase/LRE-like protein [Massilia sp. Root418]
MTAQTTDLAPRLTWQLGAELGEGPLWLPEQQRLYFVNLKGSTLHALDADGSQHAWTLPTFICWIVPRQDGDGFMAGLRDGVVRLWLEPELRFEYVARPTEGKAGVRLNDAKADLQGRLWFGSMNAADVHSPDGQLFRLAADGELTVAQDGVHICNGPAFSLDGSVMYHSDSLLNRTYAYDVAADGGLGPARLWRQFGDGEGSPDGMTVDTEGCVWIAQWGGSRVCRYSADGELLATIAMPVSQPASCVFGGPDLKTLYITTAWEGLSEAQRAAEPLAGSLFAVQLDVGGAPPARYGK